MDYKKDESQTDVRIEGQVKPMRSNAAMAATRRSARKSPTPKITALPSLPGQVVALDPVEKMIGTWKPLSGDSAKAWPTVAESVRTQVRASKPPTAGRAKHYLRTLTRHMALRHLAGHRIDDLVELLSDETIQATYGSDKATTLTKASRRTEVSHLRQMRTALLPEVYPKKEAVAVEKEAPVEWYSEKELTALLTWARGRGAKRNARVHANVLLSIACGLDRSEISLIRGIDIQCAPWGVIVQAPGAPGKNLRPRRIVPVLAKYEHELAELARIAGEKPLLGERYVTKLRPANEAQPLTPGVPVCNALRGRANWMRTLLEGGATYVAMRQVGASLSDDRLIAYLSKDLSLPISELITKLRMSSEPFDPTAFTFLTQWAE